MNVRCVDIRKAFVKDDSVERIRSGRAREEGTEMVAKDSA